MRRPFGVTLIGCWCFAAGVYLCSIAAILILAPKAIPSVRYLPFVYALKTISPYPTLAIGIGWSTVAWGVFRMCDWARFTAALFLGIGAIWGVGMLFFSKHATWVVVVGSLEIALKAAAVWYLMSFAIIDAFNNKRLDAPSPNTSNQ